MSEERDDIAAAADRMKAKFGSRRELRKLGDYLAAGESVSEIAAGRYGKGEGILVLTDRRLFFLQDGWGSKSSEDFPLSAISSISLKSGLALATIVISASGSKSEIEQVRKVDGQRIVDAARATVGQSQVPAALPTQQSVADKLRELAALRDDGILTEEEFATAKANLLATS